jgi:hypothetical protein
METSFDIFAAMEMADGVIGKNYRFKFAIQAKIRYIS